MAIENGKFIEVTYIGRLENGQIFDATDENVAKEANIFEKNKLYGPAILCVGEAQIIAGLDEAFVGKEIGTEFKVTFGPDKGFGNKDAEKIKLIATSKFLKEKINPVPNLTVFVNNQMGFVKTVSGGRTMVDFNHPLSGKALSYTATITKEITDDAQKLNALAKNQFKTDKTELKDGIATITVSKDVPEPVAKIAEKHITRLIPTITKVTFTKG